MNRIDKTAKYEGYLWMSDKMEPKIFNGQQIDFESLELQKHFVVEGQLYDSEHQKSYSIKYVTGQYIVTEYNIKNIEKECGKGEDVDYLSNRMKYPKLYFKQFWKKEEDELCEGMNVLKPAAFVFVGFKVKED